MSLAIAGLALAIAFTSSCAKEDVAQDAHHSPCSDCSRAACSSAVVGNRNGVWEIERSQLLRRLECLGPHAEGQLIPKMIAGKIEGLSLFGSPPESVFRTLGLEQGDVLIGIDKLSFHSPASLASIFVTGSKTLTVRRRDNTLRLLLEVR